jgi:hypothetical protein
MVDWVCSLPEAYVIGFLKIKEKRNDVQKLDNHTLFNFSIFNFLIFNGLSLKKKSKMRVQKNIVILIINFTIFNLLIFNALSQTVVATDDQSYTGNSSAMLDVKSTTKGLLIPRMTGTTDQQHQQPCNRLVGF